jgi:hypothetical protein
MLYHTQREAHHAANKSYCEVIEAGNMWAIKPILVDVNDVASLKDCSVRKVYQLKAAGKMPKTVHPTPGKTRWKLGDIMNLTY